MVVQIVWVVWFIFALLALCIATLCIGYILAVIPIAGSYVHALITLPVLAFKSAFKLHFISQFGSEYQIIWQSSPQSGFPVIFNESESAPPPV
jgi:hypothetical protein